MTGWAAMVMVFAGVLGGAINVALGDVEKPSREAWAKSVLVGIGAAFLVPLFLKTVSSSLVADILKPGNADEASWWVFGGFCLLAAISSRKFIQSLSDSILKEARDARREAETATRSAEGASVTAQAAQDAVGYQSGSDSNVEGTGIVGKLRSEVPPTFPVIPRGPIEDDPWAGQFGYKSSNNRRLLQASILPVPGNPDLRAISLTVQSLDPEGAPLQGFVKFFLHPTFRNPTPVVPVSSGGAARLAIIAWGAFTVGALADEGKTRLELDLAKQPGADEPWASR